ncbi:MAG: glycosyltransferase family 4 protein [Dehalococcoidia bacterium]|jgi:phosphatidylinositol alpha-mannosyltransferase
MKIALVCPYDFAHPGGVANHITFLYRELQQSGHTVKIIAPYSGNRESLENKDIITIGRPVAIPSAGSIARITLSPTLSSPVKAVLEQEMFDIIHLHDPLYSMVTLTVLRHSTSTNIGTFHAFQKTRIPYHLISPMFQRSFDRLHGRIAVSEPARLFISGYFPSEYRIIPNGIDFKRFSTPLPPVEKLRDGKLNILFVGRAEKRKGLNFLLEAYPLVKREIPQSRLVIAGPETRQKYEPMARKMALEDVVFTDYIPNDELPSYYQTCDVFCAPATGGESFGIILLEAMAASRAIVASNIDGYASLISNGAEGLLVPPRDARALAGAIVTLLKDEVKRREMGARGLEKAERYSWPNVAKTINEYYICIHNELKCGK